MVLHGFLLRFIVAILKESADTSFNLGLEFPVVTHILVTLGLNDGLMFVLNGAVAQILLPLQEQ
jgi:hypothetical protein